MSVSTFVRRGARVSACVLTIWAAAAEAQQAPSENLDPIANGSQPDPGPNAEKAAEPASLPVEAPSEPGTSALPELLVDADTKKPKKAARAKSATVATPTSGGAPAVSQEPPPPGVVFGTAAPSDTGSTTFDANNVNLRTDGSGDANTFMRNLPNVQYQNNAARGTSSGGGATSQGLIDTKPELLSISGGRTYENNFVLNGVSISNITGPAERRNNTWTDQLTIGAPDPTAVYGMSPQNIYVPSDFIGTATIIDSNASAEYGQFLGGAVLYELTAPPTDRYRASVSATHDRSEWSSYILATANGTNPGNLTPPKYEKTNLSASVGAPITSNFAFIAQASRREAESERQGAPQLGYFIAPEDSDNIFLRFAATARTDIGKFTLDTSRTDYTQKWVWWFGHNMVQDTETESTTTQLKYETDLPGVRDDSIGLGRVQLTSRVFYNDNETQNSSGANTSWAMFNQRFSPTGQLRYDTDLDSEGWCFDIPATNPMFNNGVLPCNIGGFGNILQGQTDFGVQANLKGDLLFGRFGTGIELKQYEGTRARLEDAWRASSGLVIYNNLIYRDAGTSNIGAAPAGGFNCGDANMCSPGQFASAALYTPKFDTSATLNALHTYAEVDQTWDWFNVRAGVRLDYDDYFDNFNFAPRLAASVTPFDGLRFTLGYNRYYIGETLYYALRDKQPGMSFVMRDYNSATSGPGAWTEDNFIYEYKSDSLATPYSDEYTAAVSVRDPLLGGLARFKYLERHGEDQFASETCGWYCWAINNEGENFYRSASAEYTKEWGGLTNPFFLNAAAITGNVTWSEQENSKNTYLVNVDLSGDGELDLARIYYNGASYRPEEFDALTGNLDIPVRLGATLSTVWFNGILELNATAGVNFSFQGVADTATTRNDAQIGAPVGCTPACRVWEDRKFKTTLKLDVSGQINVTEQAAIVFSATNLTNSDQNIITTNANYPWVLGRSYFVGSTVKF